MTRAVSHLIWWKKELVTDGAVTCQSVSQVERHHPKKQSASPPPEKMSERRYTEQEEALEIKSLRRIIAAYANYQDAAERDVKRYERSFKMLPPAHKELLFHLGLKYQRLRWCISMNAAFIMNMLEAFEPPFDMSQYVNDEEEHMIGCSQPLGSDLGTSQGVDVSCNGDTDASTAAYCQDKDVSSSSAVDNVTPRHCTGSLFKLNVPPIDVDKLMVSPYMQLLTSLLVVLDILYCLLLLLVILLCFMQVRCIVRNIVRDWAEEGQKERDECYKPILEELNRLFPNRSNQRPPSCLVPGAGLGRLALEISSLAPKRLMNGLYILGYTVTAILFQIMINFGLFHFLIYIPQGITEGFSMCAGDFVEVYSEESQESAWDAVVTCFFLDTAHNIVEYIEIISKVLKDGGVWINLGPLLYHFADSYGPDDDMSIELSLEDVKKVAYHYGFVMEVEKMIETTYTANMRAMMQNRYRAAFWTMRKNASRAKAQKRC
ncbi:uncharacterized protein C2845_PM08G13540 [Panicum miliaceum]|uniref:carnosine N-methyltransferase n=1 Tax=Panicum miliaceum TaxID=4540 RepID=A0A3L6QXX9_PANMI|nr:uncharacterized protein C2845_PM08G13540 [Panicum miliaceum]